MFDVCGKDIYMPTGDYGVPLEFALKDCGCCWEELVDTDSIQFALLREGREVLTRVWSYGELGDGRFVLTLTAAESADLAMGVYGWQLRLLRADETKNALTGGLWMVGRGDRW